MKTFEELKREISLFAFACSNGYVYDKRAGSKWPVLKHPSGDKIILVNTDQTTQGYFNPCDDRDKGAVLQFVKNRLGSIFPKDIHKNDWQHVLAILNDYLKEPAIEKKLLPSFQKTKRNKLIAVFDENLLPLTNRNYLISRCINQQTLSCKLFEGTMYNYKCFALHEYIAFPYRNEYEKIGAIEIRNHDCKIFQKGSNRSTCVWHSNIPNPIRRVCFFESPIDALSFFQLYGCDDALYIAFGGQVAEGQLETAKKIIEKSLMNDNKIGIYSCFDNDAAGERYTEKLKKHFTMEDWIKPSKGKDFNEQLMQSLS